MRLRRAWLLEQEPSDRVIVVATEGSRQGLSQDDLAWLLGNVAAGVLILRPAGGDARSITNAPDGYF